jgi:hypothetical protein
MTAARMSGGAPGGTIATIFSVREDVPGPLLARSQCDWSLSPVLGARSPAHRFVYRLGNRYGALFPFGAINRALVQRTAGLLALAHLECKRAEPPPPSYGPAFTYTEFMPTGSAVSAFLTSFVIAVTFWGILFVTPVRCCCLSPPPPPPSSAHFFTGPVAGQAPSDAARVGARRSVRCLLFFSLSGLEQLLCSTLEDGWLEWVNITVSDEPSPRYAKTTIVGRGDPGTLLTATIVGESAIALVLDELPPLAKGGGVLTPMTALGDNIVRRMEASGRFDVTSGTVDGPDGEIEESRKAR